MTTKRAWFPDEKNIASVVCVIPNREDFMEEDYEKLWFSKADYQMSRTSAKALSRETKRRGYSKHLDGTYNEKSTEAVEQLQLWSRHGHGRRGLERWANCEHGEQRYQDQFKVIMAVLEAQDEMLYSREGKVDAEKLRKVYYQATRVSRHFALMMGKADSCAMACDLENDETEDGGKEDAETVVTASTTLSEMDGPSNGSSAGSLTTLRSIDADTAPRVDELKDSTHIVHERGSRFRKFPFRRKGKAGRRGSTSSDVQATMT